LSYSSIGASRRGDSLLTDGTISAACL